MIKCKICRNKFYAKPSWILKGWGKYCSKECQFEAQRKGRIVPCFICGEPTYKTKKDLRVSKSKKYFCSKRCQAIWRNSIVYVGKNHLNWKGGESVYRDTLIRNKIPQYCRACKIKDLRILTVHHIDQNRKNNNINNLVWLCYNCHHLIHRNVEENKKFMEALV